VSEEDIIKERERLARVVMQMMERRGEEISRAMLAAETGLSKSRIDQVFPDDADLRETITALWYAPKLAVMDEVMASDLPPRRKMYEFFARRFVLLRQNYREDPATFRFYVELGEAYFEYARSYIDLGDHYLCELIAEAQAEGHMQGLEINQALSLINQMVNCYLHPYLISILDERLSEDKLAHIIDTIFDGMSAEGRGALGVNSLRLAGSN